MTWIINIVGLRAVTSSVIGAVIGAVEGLAIGFVIWSLIWAFVMLLEFDWCESSFKTVSEIGIVIGAFGGLMIGAVKGITSVTSIQTMTSIWIVDIGVGIGIWIVVVFLTTWWAKQIMWNRFTTLLCLLVMALGTSWGIACIIGLFNPFTLLALVGTGVPLTFKQYWFYLQHSWKISGC